METPFAFDPQCFKRLPSTLTEMAQAEAELRHVPEAIVAVTFEDPTAPRSRVKEIVINKQRCRFKSETEDSVTFEVIDN